MHSALQVADYIIAYSKGMLHPGQVVFITFLAHGYNWGINHTRLILDYAVTFDQGPIFKIVYNECADYGNHSITRTLFSHDDIYDRNVIKEIDDANPFTAKEKEVIESVVDSYETWSLQELADLLRKRGTPWKKHYHQYHGEIVIPDDDIRRYYEGIVKKSGKTTIENLINKLNIIKA